MRKKTNLFQIPWTFSAIIIAIFMHFIAVPGVSAQTNHLADGISFYNSEKYDEALNEFRAEIEINEHCPLAYYYAAKIRIDRAQFSRAIQNLEAALRDSLGFHDANGLLAFTLNKSGFAPEALVAWDTFTRAVGIIDGNTKLSPESIIPPEDYHALLKLDSERKQREKLISEKNEQARIEGERKKQEEITAEKNERDRLETARLENARRTEDSANADSLAALAKAANEPPSPSNISPEDTAGFAEENGMDGNIDLPIEDLSTQINAAIRRVIFVLAMVLLVSALFFFAAVRYTRKRKSNAEETVFSEEVERIINDRV